MGKDTAGLFLSQGQNSYKFVMAFERIQKSHLGVLYLLSLRLPQSSELGNSIDLIRANRASFLIHPDHYGAVCIEAEFVAPILGILVIILRINKLRFEISGLLSEESSRRWRYRSLWIWSVISP